MNEAESRQEFLDFMYELESEPEHVLHVSKLSLMLFDQLKELHQLDGIDRLILEAAGCLHDIGWSISPGGIGFNSKSTMVYEPMTAAYWPRWNSARMPPSVLTPSSERSATTGRCGDQSRALLMK